MSSKEVKINSVSTSTLVGDKDIHEKHTATQKIISLIQSALLKEIIPLSFLVVD
jgi:hypothetical protein